MIVEFDVHVIDGLYETDATGSGISPETIARYMSAGILFPDEIRQVERLLRHLNTAV